MKNTSLLQDTINAIATKGKGILAADESASTIQKRLESVGVSSTEENRRAYRELLLSTPKLNQYIAGIILFEETLYQSTEEGVPFSDLLNQQKIVPGIKVDKGLVFLPDNPIEKITEGLDGLEDRLKKYKEKGARFAKWRAVYTISHKTPTRLARQANAEGLARYAAICQAQEVVPIVEPEVLIDGSHTIEECFEAIECVLRAVFLQLSMYKVSLEHMILKPSMVLAGKENTKADASRVAEMTVSVLRRTVPAAVPTINFLSGGQTPEEATENLNAMNLLGAQPWLLSFSYGRALQDPCLKAWRGKKENVTTAQHALLHRAKMNSAACLGQYLPVMEK